ncbi:MAG: MMPL family transporter, partial [Methylococcaceae bacterium]
MSIPRLIAALARRCALHPWHVLSLAALLSVLASYAAVQLPVHTSRQALLPQNTEVARRLNSFLEKFGAASDLMVVIEGAPRAELESFATELAVRLRREPEVAQVTERLDPGFFLQHAYLLIPAAQLDWLSSLFDPSANGKRLTLTEALTQIQTVMAAPPSMANADIRTVTDGIKAGNALLAEWSRWLEATATPAGLDWPALSTAVGAGELGSGYFASRNGQMLISFVHARNPSGDFEVLAPFNTRVRAVAETLAGEYRSAGRPAPVIGLTGLPAIEYEEYVDIDRDIRLVIWTAGGLIAALILLVVRSIRWAIAIFVPMGLGALWSLALALGTVGHLTLITSSFLAILFGLGADYGIFTSSRIAEERRAGRPLIDAIAEGMGSSFPALLTAGGASLVIFGALATVDFPGFAELGLVAAGGVLLILVSTWIVQPAIYALLPPRLRTAPVLPEPAELSQSRGAFPKPVALILVLLAFTGAGLGIERGLSIPFDYDVLSLLPVNSKAAQYQRRMVTETDYQSEVVIFTAKDLAEARRISLDASQLQTIAKVQSITNLFPVDADQRLSTARHMGENASHDRFAEHIAMLSRDGINGAHLDQLNKILMQGRRMVEDGQEQAFSAGQTGLVTALETALTQIEILQQHLKADPETARLRTEGFYRALLKAAGDALSIITGWRMATPLTPVDLPANVRDRFFSADGTVAVYAFPAQSVYNPDNLDRLLSDVYQVSPLATGFPTTHQVFSKAVVKSFTEGTTLAVCACLIWLMVALRSLRGFILASLPLLIGGGWMLGLMAMGGLRYNYAN